MGHVRIAAIVAALLGSALLTFPASSVTIKSSAEASGAPIPVGAGPFGVAAAAGRVYVTNNRAGTLSVIDAATELVVGTIPVAAGPGMIAVDASRGRAWVSSFDTASTQVVDLALGTVVATVAAGGLGVDIDRGAGRVYAASSGSLTVIDADTNAIVAIVQAPLIFGGWWGVAVNSVSHRVYVTDVSHDALVVIDGGSNAILATIPMTPTPSRFGIAVDETSGYVYVASWPSATFFTTGTLRVIDGATNSIVASFPMYTPSLGVAIDPARHRAYATNSSGTGRAVAIFDTSTLTYLGLHATGWGPAGVAVDAGSGKVFVANPSDDSVSVIPATNQVPVIDSLAITPASPTTVDILTPQIVARDSSGQPTDSAHYEWRRNGDLVSLGLTLDLSTIGYGDKGDVITVTAVARDQVSESAPASASVTIVDSPPTVSVTLSSTSPRSRDTLFATAVPSDLDGDPVLLTYVWRVNGTVRQTTTTTTSTTSTFDLSRGTAINRDVVTVEVTPIANGVTGSSATATAIVRQSPIR